MKVAAVVVRDGEGERRFDLDRLPLRLGTGSDCQIRLPGPGNAPVALIDELDGEPFVQPVGRSGMQINGQPLSTSKRLAVGDVLTFFGSRIEIAMPAGQADALLATVHLEDSAYITRPPELASDAGAADEAIAPTAFRRAAEGTSEAPPSNAYRWQAGVGTGIVLLVLASWLLFSSKSIQFQIEPVEPDRFSITGGWFRLPVGNRILLRPGNYTVNVQKEGYYEVSQSLLVGDEPSRTVTIELRKLPGKLTVITDPVTEAMVTVDDSNVGPAPFGPLVLEPGIHSVSVTADRFLPFNDRIVVPGLDRYQELHVQLVPRWANVELTSNPSGTAVYRGQERIGETPARLELVEGSHQLSVVLDGFKAWDGIVETAANEDKVLPTIQLEPANAELQVNSIPVGASVTVNGR
ncbi:MAG TPA: PEGA domain-containing protein, partial [Woeseiaceae bacterium]|nr:PEGA domain-containing protein [Woeseiaceae bacterium]